MTLSDIHLMRMQTAQLSLWRWAWRRGAIAVDGAMGRLSKYLELPWDEKRRVLYAAMLVIGFRVGLWCVPFRFLRSSAEVKCGGPARCEGHELALKTATYVRAISRYVPAASCLTQALTTVVLLRRGGLIPELRIGAGRDDVGAFRAHAWVEWGGRIVIGDLPELGRYERLKDLRSSAVVDAA